MATSDASVPYAVQAASHGAQLFRLAVGSALPQGIGGLDNAQGGTVLPGDLAVSAGTGNTVNVASGQCWVPGSQGSDQGLYYCLAPSGVTGLTITPNASNPLVALVTASVNDAYYLGNPGVPTNEWDLLVTQGTAASSPSIPTTPDNSLVLATILVPANASDSSSYTIVQGLGTISGTTLSAPAGQTIAPTIGAPCGRVYQSGTGTYLTGGATTTVGNMVVDFLRGGFATYGTTGLTVPVTGIYSVTWCVNLASQTSGTNTYLYLNLARNGTTVRRAGTGGENVSGAYSVITGTDIVSLNATDYLTMSGYPANYAPITQVGSSLTFLSAALVSF